MIQKLGCRKLFGQISMATEMILINSRDELYSVDSKMVVYFESNGNYTQFITSNKLKGIIGFNLSKTEQMLTEQLKEQASTFMRVGKRFIVNTEYIYCINIPKQYLILSDMKQFAFQLPISKDALKRMKELIIEAYKTNSK